MNTQLTGVLIEHTSHNNNIDEVIAAMKGVRLDEYLGYVAPNYVITFRMVLFLCKHAGTNCDDCELRFKCWTLK